MSVKLFSKRSFKPSAKSALLALLVLTAMVSGCAVNPVTGKNELSFISEAKEISIGAEQYLPSQQSQGGLYKIDRELTQYVNEVGQRLARVSDRQLPYEFVVLNNSVPNAWALPGGKIAVNRGLLLHLNSEAELAAVLGHEIVHAAAKHGALSMQRGMIMQGLVMVTAISTADSEFSNYILGGAQVGAQLISTKYGRDAELESDYYGMQYMARAGYDPAAAITLQETFVELSEGHEGSWLEGLFASHPPSQNRVDTNRRTAAEINFRGEINREQYQDKIAYLISRQSAYEKLDEAMEQAAKSDLDLALASIRQAIKEEPKEARFYGAKGEIMLAKKDYKDAQTAFSDALKRDDEFFQYYLGRGMANARLGDRAAAKSDLEQSNQLLPTAVAANELGQIALVEGNSSLAKQYFGAAMNSGGSVGERAKDAFITLDFEDNPGAYVQTQVFMTDDGQLWAKVANTTGKVVESVNLAFVGKVNGNDVTKSISVGQMAAGAQGNINSGWRFSNTDQIDNLEVKVISARLAR